MIKLKDFFMHLATIDGGGSMFFGSSICVSVYATVHLFIH